MKKLIPILLGVLLLATPFALATNHTSEDIGVEDVASPSPLSVIQSDYVVVKEQSVEETETSYQVDATIEVEFDGDCNHGAIRQLTIDLDETNEVLQCKGLGLGVCSPKKVHFNFEVPKKKINNIIEEEGQATLIAVRHSGWSCGWVNNKYPHESEGAKVHRFSAVGELISMSLVLFLIVVSLIGGGAYFAYRRFV